MTASTLSLEQGSRWLRWPEAALAIGIATIIVFGLRSSALSRLLRRHDATNSASHPAALREAQIVGATVRRLADRMPGKPRCLVRAVAVHLMLRRRGIAHGVRFGVRKTDGALEAHAWVSIGETRVIGAREGENFTPLAQFGRVPE